MSAKVNTAVLLPVAVPSIYVVAPPEIARFSPKEKAWPEEPVSPN